MCYSDEELTTPSDCDVSDFDHMMFSDSNVKPSAFKNKQFFCEKKPESRSSALCMEAVAQVSLGKKVAEVERELRPDTFQNGFNGICDLADGDKSHEPCFPWQQKSKWQKSSGMPPPPPAMPAVNGESNIPLPPPPMPQILSPPVQTNFKKAGFMLEGVKLRKKSGPSNPPPPTRVDSLKHKLGMQQGRENLKPVALPGMSELHKEEPLENGCSMKPKLLNGSVSKIRFPLRSIESKEQQCQINVQKQNNLQQTSPKPTPQNPLFKPRDLKRSAKKLNIYSPTSPKQAPATLPKPPTPNIGNSNPPKLFKSETKPKMMLESPTQSLPQRWLQNLPKWNAQNREAQNPETEDLPLPPPPPSVGRYNFKVKTKKVKSKPSLGFVKVGQVWVPKVRFGCAPGYMLVRDKSFAQVICCKCFRCLFEPVSNGMRSVCMMGSGGKGVKQSFRASASGLKTKSYKQYIYIRSQAT